MWRLYIIGTGSHARKVCYYALDLGWEVAGFVDEASNAKAPLKNFDVMDLPKKINQNEAVFVAIGQPIVRRRLMDSLSGVGWALPALVHRTAWVAPDAILESGVLVAAGAIVETSARIGRGAIIDIGALVDHDSEIEEFFHLRPGQVCHPREHRRSFS